MLRKKPKGKLLPSAHAIDRKYQVINALQNTDVPVPKTVHYCADDSVIGTEFYVMEYLSGRVLRDPLLPEMHAEERKAIYRSMNDTLAALHNVDWKTVGLDDYGKTDHYISRQIRRWSQQYMATKTNKDIPALDKLMAWLSENIPTDPSAAITHGDFRLENLMFHKTKPEIIAVLDWELSTLGHPLCDLAYNCMAYHFPSAAAIIKGFVGVDIKALGIPSEKKYLNDYCLKTGRGEIKDWNFYMAFSMFRVAAILQGVYVRALKGNASSEIAHQMGELYPFVAKQGCSLVEEVDL